jgi:hypothetical protein
VAELTAARAIERAEHALRTGQPNLASIYMRRASVLVAEDHAAARRRVRQARIRNARNPVELIWLAVEDMTIAAQTVWDAIREAFSNSEQSKYALAGPSKGGTHA